MDRQLDHLLPLGVAVRTAAGLAGLLAVLFPNMGAGAGLLGTAFKGLQAF